jgi:hypothetical protein
MVLAFTVAVAVCAGALFFKYVALITLFGAFPPITVALSIMEAAILVRLNRGMPTLDWKSLETGERSRLTAAIVDLTKEYLVIGAVNAILLALLISLTAIGQESIKLWPIQTGKITSSVVGTLLALCLARMGYVVWRDFDIVRLQKTLIDAAGVRERREREGAAAEKKIADIRISGLRRSEPSAPREWPDKE